MEYWLLFNEGKERLQLPVNPPELEIGTSQTHTDVEVLNVGERSRIGNVGLETYAISSFFPKYHHPGWCEYRDIPDPWEAVGTIKRWRRSRQPIRFLVTGTDIDTLCSIRDFTPRERAGHAGDIWFDLQLKEHREVKLERVRINREENVTTTEVEEEAPPEPTTERYTVKQGDTLWHIAQRVYGDGDEWRRIYDENRNVVDNPNQISAGTELVIPNG